MVVLLIIIKLMEMKLQKLKDQDMVLGYIKMSKEGCT